MVVVWMDERVAFSHVSGQRRTAQRQDALVRWWWRWTRCAIPLVRLSCCSWWLFAWSVLSFQSRRRKCREFTVLIDVEIVARGRIGLVVGDPICEFLGPFVPRSMGELDIWSGPAVCLCGRLMSPTPEDSDVFD